MSWVAVAIGGSAALGAGMSYLGGRQASRAAEKGARAQAEQAAWTQRQVMDYSKGLLDDTTALADMSPNELASLSRSLGSAQASLDREERLLAAIDPALMEASQQVLSILRGGSADVNKPGNALRASQRQQLVHSLRSQYGPGAELSSIGQRALQQFDMESNVLQQQSLGQLFGMATTDLGMRQQRGIAGLQQVGQGFGAIQERKLNARMNVGAQTIGGISGTSQAMIQSAGAPFVGNALQGQAMSSLGNNIMGAGAQLGMGYLMSGRGMKPTAAPMTPYMPSAPATDLNSMSEWNQMPGTVMA